jgi:enoyl-CoA hydratase/carnithine racemase
MLDESEIAVLTINRPGRSNALDSQTLAELHEALDKISGSPAIRAVIITGSGSAFCAGADIKATPADFTKTAATPQAALLNAVSSTIAVTLSAQELMASAFEKIHRLRHPVIAAINGPAVGGAVFIRHGISACDMGTSYHLPRLVGAARSAELMLTGRIFDAAEAAAIGLVVDVVEPEQLLDRAVDKAREIARNSPLAVWMTKETMWQNIDAPSLRHALDVENRTQVLCTSTGDLSGSFASFRGDGVSSWKPL